MCTSNSSKLSSTCFFFTSTADKIAAGCHPTSESWLHSSEKSDKYISTLPLQLDLVLLIFHYISFLIEIFFILLQHHLFFQKNGIKRQLNSFLIIQTELSCWVILITSQPEYHMSTLTASMRSIPDWNLSIRFQTAKIEDSGPKSVNKPNLPGLLH